MPDFLATHYAGAPASSPSASSQSDLGLGDGIVSAWEGDDHACFADGVYTVPRDGLYAVTVSVHASDSIGEKKKGGKKAVGSKRKRGRTEVEYAVRVEEDQSVEVMDVGSSSFGEVLHLAKGAKVAIVGCDVGEGKVEWAVQRVMRKRKKVGVEEEVSERELKKRAKKKRKLARKEADAEGEGKGEEKGDLEGKRKGDVGDTVDGAKDGSEESQGSEDGQNWEDGFESDASGDDV